MESVSFVYDGKYSSDYGLYNISLSNGMYEEVFTASRKIQEVTVRGNSKPYFQGFEYEPLEFELSFAFEDTWDDKKIREIARWLTQDYYKPLWFSENPDRWFYCVSIEDATLVHNGLKQGYVKLKMRCDSPYSYTPVMTSPIYDFSTGTGVIDFVNDGDTILKPEIWIQKIGNGDVSIKNMTNKGTEFKFTGLLDAETVYVNNEREYIETSLPSTYRYENFNNNYLELVYGKNRLEVTGECKINFRYQFKTMQ